MLGSLGGVAYENTPAGEWTLAGRFHVNSMKAGPWSALVSDLKAGNYAAQPQRWPDLSIGTRHFRFSPNE